MNGWLIAACIFGGMCFGALGVMGYLVYTFNKDRP